MNLLIKNTATNKHSNIFLRIIHNICKITLTLRYFIAIYISYQMYKTWSCVTFYHSFPQANDNRITVLVLSENDLISKFIQGLATWFHFEIKFS